MILIATLALATAAPAEALPTVTMPIVTMPIDPSWGMSPIWDDGLAEVAHYDAHRKVYGVDRSYESILITVKEDFDGSRAVKADPPFEGRNLVTVLKLNIISMIRTDNYPYNYMTSVFVRRDDPRALVKVALSSQEWCGTTYKEVVTWDGSPRLVFHSYFDGQADGAHPMPLEGGELLDEQLLLVARALSPDKGAGHAVLLYDPLITNSARAPEAHPFTIVLRRDEEIVTPAGSFQTRRLDVLPSSGDGRPLMSYWIEKARRRALVKFESADGRSLVLRQISRRNYWSR
jgi:hypothetical protein